MKRHLVREATPGEVRTGLFEDGSLVEFRIDRTGKPQIKAGMRHDAVLLHRNGTKTVVGLGRNIEAQLLNAPHVPLGTRVEVEIVRPPISEPGRWKQALVRPVTATAKDREATAPSHDPIAVITDPATIEAAGFDELAEAAVSGEFAIEGGLLSIERTRAMTMIDLDGSGDSLALNLAAAREIPRLLRLLDIGGQIGIDFLNLPDRKARLAVDACLQSTCAALGPHERTAMNGFGFVQIVRPRPRASIPEILCGANVARLSVESRATGLLRLASKSVGHGPRQLVAAPAVIALLESWTDELQQLRQILGTGIELVPDASATGYGYVHASP